MNAPDSYLKRHFNLVAGLCVSLCVGIWVCMSGDGWCVCAYDKLYTMTYLAKKKNHKFHDEKLQKKISKAIIGQQ